VTPTRRSTRQTASAAMAAACSFCTQITSRSGWRATASIIKAQAPPVSAKTCLAPIRATNSAIYSDPFIVADFLACAHSHGRRVGTKRQAETEPGRLAVRRRNRQNENILEMPQSVPQILPIPPARRDEFVEALKLGQPDGRLHVGNLQIIAEMRVDVLVVISE